MATKNAPTAAAMAAAAAKIAAAKAEKAAAAPVTVAAAPAAPVKPKAANHFATLHAVVGNGGATCKSITAAQRVTVQQATAGLVATQWQGKGLTPEVQAATINTWLKCLAASAGRHPTPTMVNSVTGHTSFSKWALAVAMKCGIVDKGGIRHLLQANGLYVEAKGQRTNYKVTPKALALAASIEGVSVPHSLTHPTT